MITAPSARRAESTAEAPAEAGMRCRRGVEVDGDGGFGVAGGVKDGLGVGEDIVPVRVLASVEKSE